MRCSACQLEIEGNIKAHYSSEIHKINTRRQIYNAPPVTEEEINAEQLSDDLSLEITGMDEEVAVESIQRQRGCMSRNNPVETTCLFCDAIESYAHYAEHGVTAEDVVYIQSRVCYVCYEGFSGREDLRRHIVSGNHRNVMTDGMNLILESGKVIQGKRMGRSRECVVQQRPRPTRAMLIQKVNREDKRTTAHSKNQLKISLAMNHQSSFRPDWMQ